jgi:hypothetical protein
MKGNKALVAIAATVATIGVVASGCATGAEVQAKDPQAPAPQTAKPNKHKAANKPAPNMESVAEANARQKASDYLDTMAFSKAGLVHQLEFEGFSKADAIYGVGAANANWYKQAEKKAAEYLDTMSFSRARLINQLEFEGFTPDQANHGVTSTGL